MKSNTPEHRIAGEPSGTEKLDRMIRVNHAGESGAAEIYKGQLKILKNTDLGPILQHMLDQEKEHKARFDEKIRHHRVRPSLLNPLWKLGGFALGTATALMGKKAAMACTVAVEEVIDDHYKSQEDYLQDKPEHKDLKDLISKCRAEELEHRDIGLENEAEAALAYPLLYKSIKKLSETAIKIAKRI